MTAGASGRDVQNAAVVLYGMIVRPRATLYRISDNPATYLVPSVAVFAAGVALGALPSSLPSGYQMSEFMWDGTPYALTGSALNVLVPILGIFWIGRRWGGNRSLRRVFSALAYCLVPGTLWAVANAAVPGLYALAFPEIVPSGGMTAGLGLGRYIAHSATGAFFVGWTLLLMTRAIHILDGFGYAKSAAVLALAILVVYAASMVYGLAAAAVYEFVL